MQSTPSMVPRLTFGHHCDQESRWGHATLAHFPGESGYVALALGDYVFHRVYRMADRAVLSLSELGYICPFCADNLGLM